MVTGLLLTLIAGAMNASFPLPMRYIHKWAWENTWALWSLVALLCVPWTLALLTVPRLCDVYATTGSWILLKVAFLGALWGIAGFLFGLSVEMVGMSLTFAVVNGLSSAIGSWVPMAVLHPGKLLTHGGLLLSAGILGIVAGLVLCSWAGRLRSATVQLTCDGSTTSASSRRFRRGLIVVFICGLLAPALNLAISFSGEISIIAMALGASRFVSLIAVLAIVLTGGFIMNIGYCVFRFMAGHSFRNYFVRDSGKYLLLSVLMGVLWTMSYVIYALATTYMGTFGTVAGWPILMGVMTIVSSAVDIRLGLWGGRASRVLVLGSIALVLSVSLVSYGIFCLNKAA